MKRVSGLLNLLIAFVPGAAFAIEGATVHSLIAAEAKGSVIILGPNSKVVGLSRTGDTIKIRQCAPGTGRTEIERIEGCELAPGTEEVPLSLSYFTNLFQQELANLGEDPTGLTEEDRALLAGALTPNPDETADNAKLASIRVRLKLHDKLRDDFGLTDQDMDMGKLRDLKTEETCVLNRMSSYQSALRAKQDVAKVLDRIITDSGGSKIKWVLRYSTDKGSLAYNVLLKMASNARFVDALDPISRKMGKKDLATGRIWFANESPQLNYMEAQRNCASKLQDLPSRDQWKEAEEHGIRAAFPEMKGVVRRNGKDETYWFWSSTSYGFRSAFAFSGSSGTPDGLGHQDTRDDFLFTRCVSRMR